MEYLVFGLALSVVALVKKIKDVSKTLDEVNTRLVNVEETCRSAKAHASSNTHSIYSLQTNSYQQRSPGSYRGLPPNCS